MGLILTLHPSRGCGGGGGEAVAGRRWVQRWEGWGGAEGEDEGRANEQVRQRDAKAGCEVPLPLHCETLCERSRGMPFVCVWHKFGAQVRRAEQAC